MAIQNVVEYEFQGNLYPLEKAFKKVKSLFLSSVRDAKSLNDGKLTDDMKSQAVEIQRLMKRLKTNKHYLGESDASKQDIAEAKRLYNKILSLTLKFKKQKDKILSKKNVEEQKQRDKEFKEQQLQEQEHAQLLKFASPASQFKASVQTEQLRDFMQSIPTLPTDVVIELNAYISAWEKATKLFNEGRISEEDLAVATKNLNDKTIEYIGSLKTLNHEQQRASNFMEYVLQGIIHQISSFETWFRYIKEGISLLSDYIESLNFLEVAVNSINFDSFIDSENEAASVTEYFSEKISQAVWSLGLNATALNQATATFISFANAIGMTGNEVVTFSENISQLAVDMASLYNKDVSEVVTALRSALAGNTRALMNYGISVHDATLNEWLLSKGLNKTMNSLSETSQAMVRYLYIMEKTSNAQGDLSRTLKSPANQLKILSTQLNLLKQNLGSLFNNIIYPSIRILNNILIPLNAFISALTALSNANYSQSIGSITDAATGATEALEDASNAAVGLTALDEINQKSESTVVTGVDTDIQGLVNALGVYDGFLGTTTKLTELMKSLGEAMAPVWNIFSNTNIIDALTSSINFLFGALSPVKAILEAIKTGFQDSPSWMQAIINTILQVAGTLTSLATTVGIVAVARAGLQAIMKSTLFLNFINILKTMYLHFLYLGESIYAAIAKFITWIATIVKARIEAIKTSVANKGLAATLVSIAKSALMAMVNLVKLIAKMILQGTKAIWTAIKNLILSKSLWGVAIGAIAAAGIAAIGVAAIVGTAVLIGKATQRNNASTESTIGLAKGGIVTQPTFAMIGEGSYNEAVIPLGNSPQFKSMKEGIASEVLNKIVINSRTSDSSNRPIVLNVNGKELARTILPDIKQAIPQTVVRLLK